MIIGTPKEVIAHENRVALTPHVALELTKSGHEVLIEKSAGISTGFIDEDYQTVGCKIVENSKEICSNAELVVKVKEPQSEEVAMCYKGTTMFTYFHFAADETLTKA
jgi:alanine dehydrogenase